MKCGDCGEEIVGQYDLQRMVCLPCLGVRLLKAQGFTAKPKLPAPPPVRKVHNPHGWLGVYFMLACATCMALGIWWGYQYPRPVELESTKPVYFLLNADAQAAALLVKSCTPSQ